MRIFDGYCAWFAPNVPSAHISTWLADGGVQIKDVRKTIIQYYFSNALDDDTTIELVRNKDKVVYKSAWITDSSLSRTKQPLGSYALTQSKYANDNMFQSPLRAQKRPSYSVLSERKNLPTRSASFYPMANDISPTYNHPSRPKSVTDYHDFMKYRDGNEDNQSIRSKSSRHSNASSIVSTYGRRHQVISRFIINADSLTRSSILNDVADFTPNQHGFVAYKIPKMV